jgi:hypothetical protein
VKTALKGTFQDVEDIKKNVTAELNTFPLDDFDDCFIKLLKTRKKYAALKGHYFE